MLPAKLLVLLLIANGAPVLARLLFGTRWAWPLDLGYRCADGRALLGPSKTWRGVVTAVAATAAAAPALGLPWWNGMVIGLAAMLGDSLSSLVKRRLGFAPSAPALGLDQLPEVLLPLLAVWAWHPLDVRALAAVVGAFVVLELALSALLRRWRT